MSMTMDELHCDLTGMLEVVCHRAAGLTPSDTRVTDAKTGSDVYCKVRPKRSADISRVNRWVYRRKSHMMISGGQRAAPLF
eukprot:6757784-Pyramimonas_sp.AAC.1